MSTAARLAAPEPTFADFVISVLGGSRFQTGGPAGAFVVLVAATADAEAET